MSYVATGSKVIKTVHNPTGENLADLVITSTTGVLGNRVGLGINKLLPGLSPQSSLAFSKTGLSLSSYTLGAYRPSIQLGVRQYQNNSFRPGQFFPLEQ